MSIEVDFDQIANGLLRAAHPEPAEDTRQGWSPLDKSDVIQAIRDGVDLTPKTGILRRDKDGAGLLYPGKLHYLAGPNESMKTWVCLIAAVQTMLRGGVVGWVDLEDTMTTAIMRLHMMGVDLDVIDAQFDYLSPQRPLLGRWGTEDHDAIDALDTWLAERQPELVVIDSSSPLASLHGMSVLDNDDMTAQARLLERIPRAGPCTVVIDHTSKSDGGVMIGAQAKASQLDGAVIIIEARKMFAPGKQGEATLKVYKDRPSALRAVAMGSEKLAPIADLILTSNEETGRIGWQLNPPEGYRPFEYTKVMATISAVLPRFSGGLSKLDIMHETRAQKKTVDSALQSLLNRDHIRQDTDDRYHHVSPYVEDAEPVPAVGAPVIGPDEDF